MFMRSLVSPRTVVVTTQVYSSPAFRVIEVQMESLLLSPSGQNEQVNETDGEW